MVLGPHGATPNSVAKSIVGMRCIKYLVNGRPVALTNPMPETRDEIVAAEIYKSATDIPEQLLQYAYAGQRTVGTVPCALVEYWTWTGVVRRK